MHILRVLLNKTKQKDTVGSTQLTLTIIGMIDGGKSTTIPHWDSLEDIERATTRAFHFGFGELIS